MSVTSLPASTVPTAEGAVSFSVLISTACTVAGSPVVCAVCAGAPLVAHQLDVWLAFSGSFSLQSNGRSIGRATVLGPASRTNRWPVIVAMFTVLGASSETPKRAVAVMSYRTPAVAAAMRPEAYDTYREPLGAG